MKVLQVDANEDCRAAVATELAATVEAVGGAAAARAALADASVDCVVTELALPDADGVAFVDDLTDARPDLPVLAYTGVGDESLAGDVVAAGADGYVAKPDVETLAERVRRLAGGAAPGPDRASLVVEQAPMAVVEWDREFRVVSWNAAAADLFGYDRETALGQQAWDLMVPASARDAVEEVWSSLLSGEGGQRGVTENVRADGSRFHCEWHSVLRHDENGDVVGVLSFARDVTDRERRSHVLEALQRTTGEMIRMDSREEIAAAAVSTIEDVIGHPLSAVRLHDPDRNRLDLAAITEAGESILDAAGGPRPIGPGDDVAWDVFETGEPRSIERLAPDQSVYGADVPVASLLVYPLGENGVVVVGDETAATFDADDRRLLSILATTVEAAMDRAERQRSLERYRTIVAAAGDGVFTLDADGRYVQVNDRFVDATGYDRETLLGASPDVVLEEASVARARSEVRSLVEGSADVVTYEVTAERPDGDRVPFEVSQSRLPGTDFEGTVGTAREITERKRMERELRERKRKIEAMHDVASDLDACDTPAAVGSVAVAAAERVLDFDECALRVREGDRFRLLDSTTAEAPTYRDADGLYGETMAAGESRLISDLREGDVEVENPWNFRSALSVPVGDDAILQSVSAAPGAFDEDDVELAELLASHVADSLDRLAVEGELRTERDRFAALFDNVPDPVVAAVHTEAGPVVRDVNPAFEETFGFDAEDIVGDNLDDRIVPEGRAADAAQFNREALGGDIVEAEVRRRTADGLRDFRLTVVPVDLGEESHATFGVYTDVTDRKQRRKRVEVLNRVLRHDLRNGMNIVRGEAELLADQLDEADATHARTILDRADELLRLGERTRAVERALDRDTSTAGPIDLAAVVERTAADLSERFPGARITVEAPDRAVVVAETLVELAVLDAMENAVVHNDRDAPTVDVRVATDDDDVVVRIADDGPGIPDDERRLLTGEEEISQLHHGSGLGLWLVHWAVTHSGGSLIFDSNEPRGSVVTMRLPARTPPRSRHPAED